MLKKMFEKYAAKLNGEAREKLFRLFCAKWALFFAFAAFLIIWAVEIAVFWNLTDPAALSVAFAVYGITMFLWAACGIASFVLHVVFRVRFRRAGESCGEVTDQ